MDSPLARAGPKMISIKKIKFNFATSPIYFPARISLLFKTLEIDLVYDIITQSNLFVITNSSGISRLGEENGVDEFHFDRGRSERRRVAAAKRCETVRLHLPPQRPPHPQLARRRIRLRR